MPETRSTYIVGAWRIPPARRDVSSPVLADPDAGYTDVIDADDGRGVALGAPVTYRAELTDAQADAFRGASNLRYLEPDGHFTADLLDVVPAGPVAAAGTHGVPTDRTLAYMDATGLEAQGWDGSGRVGAVLDGGTSEVLKALFGWRIVDRWDFVADTAGTAARNPHGCYVTCEAIPAGAGLAEYVVFDASGSASWSNVARAIRRAADHRCDVLNFSGSGPAGSQAIRDAIAYATRVRPAMVLFASAGNDGKPEIGYPAAYPEFRASIAADETTDRKAAFSNHAATAAGMTPGVKCRSCDPDGQPVDWSGTSSSSPKKMRLCLMGATVDPPVAGRTAFAPRDVAAALGANARDTPEPTTREGNGAYQLRAALARLGAFDPPPPPAGPEPWWRRWLRG